MKDLILLRNDLVDADYRLRKEKLEKTYLGTLVSNFAYYGFVPSKNLFKRLSYLSKGDVKAFWSKVEPVLKEVTGADKNMGEHVVYKNFPEEVLNMTDAEYWLRQIIMYLGFPNELVTEEEEDRESLFEKISLKVLHLADENSLKKICDQLLASSVRWTKEQRDFIDYLVFKEGIKCNPTYIPFKENMVSLIAKMLGADVSLKIKSATDVLRLAVGMSDGDVSMREKSKFRKFSRAERRFFLKNLEGATSLAEDMARNCNKWKKFMKALRPGDYASTCTNVNRAYNALYNGELVTFNSQVETLYAKKDEKVLALLMERPGEFMRRLQSMISVFKGKASKQFLNVIPNLTIYQLLKLEKYLVTINQREFRMFPPKGNWGKVQIVENEKKVKVKHMKVVVDAIREEVASRISEKYPLVNVSKDVDMVKLQGNDSDLTNYGRGTEFVIPEDVKFIRTASYWACARDHNVWFDNSWNLFDEEWRTKGVCCWNEVQSSGIVFSGDPTNSKTKDGKACQMIDLDIDKLEKRGVRYAVWSILCYSGIPFDDSEDVFAAMQWGEDAQKGKLFEPSRCQLSFPVKGKNLTKYIALVDIQRRRVVYMDANFKGRTDSARGNQDMLTETMPPFMEYLETQPSVYDIFRDVNNSEDGVPVVYDDSDVKIKDGEAYVFNSHNKKNCFEQIDIPALVKG